MFGLELEAKPTPRAAVVLGEGGWPVWTWGDRHVRWDDQHLTWAAVDSRVLRFGRLYAAEVVATRRTF